MSEECEAPKEPPQEGQRYQWVTRVGDIVRPTDGGDYRGIVIEVTPTHVRHRCLATGAVHRKGRAGFSVRYRRLVTP